MGVQVVVSHQHRHSRGRLVWWRVWRLQNQADLLRTQPHWPTVRSWATCLSLQSLCCFIFIRVLPIVPGEGNCHPPSSALFPSFFPWGTLMTREEDTHMKSKESISERLSTVQTKERFFKKEEKRKELYTGWLIAKGSLGLPWQGASDWVAITTEIYFPHSSRGWKSKIKVSAGWFLPTSLLGLYMAVFSLSLHMVFPLCLSLS